MSSASGTSSNKDPNGALELEVARGLTLGLTGTYGRREGTRALGLGTYIRRQAVLVLTARDAGRGSGASIREAAIVGPGVPMKMKAVVHALVCAAATASTVLAQRSPAARETAPDALQQMLDRGEKVLVIDVRTDEEVKTGSIPGAVHIPTDQLEARMKDVPRDVQLVFT